MNNKGFTLLEVLVAMLVMAIGLLGIGLHLGKGIRANLSNGVHETAMQIAFQTTEPLNQALRQGPQAFQSSLQNYLVPHPPTSLFQGMDAVSGNFTVQILRAYDSPAADGETRNLFSDAPSLWQPPFTVELNVAYTGDNGYNISFPTRYVLSP